jgi:hypothetical protein
LITAKIPKTNNTKRIRRRELQRDNRGVVFEAEINRAEATRFIQLKTGYIGQFSSYMKWILVWNVLWRATHEASPAYILH